MIVDVFILDQLEFPLGDNGNITSSENTTSGGPARNVTSQDIATSMLNYFENKSSGIETSVNVTFVFGQLLINGTEPSSSVPTMSPARGPSTVPTSAPSFSPTYQTDSPSGSAITESPTLGSTETSLAPTSSPTNAPATPTKGPSNSPILSQTESPTKSPFIPAQTFTMRPSEASVASTLEMQTVFFVEVVMLILLYTCTGCELVLPSL